MTTHSSTSAAALLGLMAVSIPCVSQAQDPGNFQKQAYSAIKAQNYSDALKIIDNCINKFGNPKSRMYAQFGNQLGWFYYQRGVCLMNIPGAKGSPDYESALAAFKECHTNKLYADLNVNQFRNIALYQMGQCEFKMGEQGAPEHYAKAIEYFTQYLNIYEKRKNALSPLDQKSKLDGSIHLLLAQCNILKTNPDFKAAMESLGKASSKRSTVSDKMLMDTAKCLINTAIRPETNQPALAIKAIASAPEIFNLGTLRMAAHAGDFLNLGFKCYNLGREAVAGGKKELGEAYYQLSLLLLGLVPETNELRSALKTLSKEIGPITVTLTNGETTFSASQIKSLLEHYDQVANEHLNFEANALLAVGSLMIDQASNRGAKAVYQILEDRYPKLQKKVGEGEFTPLREDNLYQLAMAMRASGDVEGAQKAEARHRSLFPDSKYMKSLSVNLLAQLLSEQRYEEALEQARSVMSANQETPTSDTYILAAYAEASALFKLNHAEELVEAAKKFLEQFPNDEKYSNQVLFYLLNAQNDVFQSEDCIKSCELYIQKYPAIDLQSNPMLPHVYYTLITNLMKLNTDAGTEKAMSMIDKLVTDFPEHELYPVALLLRASMLITKESAEDQIKAIDSFRQAYEASKGKDELRQIKANALYCLASYIPDIEIPDKDNEARLREANNYIKTYWESADYEGNPYSLQIAALELGRTLDDKSKRREDFDKVSKRMQELITREAKLAFTQDKLNPEVESAVNSYTQYYIDGAQKYDPKGVGLTLDQIREHFYNFPGISQKDNYTRAILRMAVINQMTSAMRALPRSSKDQAEADAAKKKYAELEKDVEQIFREMVNTFSPKVLTEFINVQVGNYLIGYVQRFEDTTSKDKERREAIAYFDEGIRRHGSFYDEAIFGKAKALGLSTDANEMQAGVALLQPLTQSENSDVAQNAMVEMTRIYMKKKEYDKAIATAGAYIENKRNVKERLPMLMLLGDAYAANGDTQNALLTYMNLYNQNISRIQYSAPACEAIMKLQWERNNPESTSEASDRWKAWNMGRMYIQLTEPSEQKFTPEDRDKWRVVRSLTAQYGSDPAVAQEEKARIQRRAMLQKNK
ncbi:MAG: hypothetical protein LUE08_07485 [Akkermansiaceae bacterium]|nr:hypothetical protein [Akkermansiaceae bacterium]